MSALDLTPEDRAASLVIENARRRNGMPKAELARRSGDEGLAISLRTLTYYLDGKRAMTLGAFRTLSAVLGLSREDAARAVARALLTLENSGQEA